MLFKLIKSEMERKEPMVKKLIDTGNAILKESTNSITNATDLALILIGINTKWANLAKRVEAKNEFFTEMGECISELRRKFSFHVTHLTCTNKISI